MEDPKNFRHINEVRKCRKGHTWKVVNTKDILDDPYPYDAKDRFVLYCETCPEVHPILFPEKDQAEQYLSGHSIYEAVFGEQA